MILHVITVEYKDNWASSVCKPTTVLTRRLVFFIMAMVFGEFCLSMSSGKA